MLSISDPIYAIPYPCEPLDGSPIQFIEFLCFSMSIQIRPWPLLLYAVCCIATALRSSIPLLNRAFQYYTLSILRFSTASPFTSNPPPNILSYRISMARCLYASPMPHGSEQLHGTAARSEHFPCFSLICHYAYWISNLGLRPSLISVTINFSTRKRPLPELRHWPIP